MEENEIRKLLKESYRVFNSLGEKGKYMPYESEMDLLAAWGRLEWDKHVAIEYIKDFIERNK